MPAVTSRKMRFRAFRTHLAQSFRTVPFRIVFRILSALLLLLPWLLSTLVMSWFKIRRWKKPENCRAFMRRYGLAFEKVNCDAIEIRPFKGGLSNANQLWSCKTREGEPVDFFVKIFIPIGSFWAKNMSLVSPFPTISATDSHQRFMIDMVSRECFSGLGIPVPKLVAYDAVEQMMVTEYVKGVNVDEILVTIEETGFVSDSFKEAIFQCGLTLGKIHEAGYSLVDAQPINCIWNEEEQKVYFTDLEYCTRQDYQIWDVSFFICYFAARLPEELRRDIQKIFFRGYARERRFEDSDLDKIKHELWEYIPVLQVILDIRKFTPPELFGEFVSWVSDEVL